MELHIFFVFTLIVSITACRFAKRRFGIWLNHYLLTNIYWIVSLIISIYFNTYKYPVSNDVYYIFLLGLLCYNCSLLFCKVPKFRGVKNDMVYSLHKRRLIELFVFVFIMPFAYKNFLLIMSGVELWYLNAEYWSEVRNAGSYLEQILRENVAETLSKILMATCFFIGYKENSRRNNILTLVIGGITALMFVIMSGGGRTPMVQFGFFAVLAFFASRHKSLKDYFLPISPNLILTLSVLGLFVLAWSSSGRGSSEGLQDILSKRLALFAPLFEYYYNYTDVFEQYTMGQSMLENVIAIFQYPFKLFGFTSEYVRNNFYIQEFVFVPKLGFETNAMVSSYFIYMRDFGMLGVVLGPFIVGSVYNILYKYCLKAPFLMAYYFIGVLGTCLSTDYPFARSFVFQLVFVLLIDKYSKIKS